MPARKGALCANALYFILAASFFVSCLATLFPQSPILEKQHIVATNPFIDYMGRTISRISSDSTRRVYFDWPCVTIRIAFTGSTTLGIRMDGGGNDFLVDGVPTVSPTRLSTTGGMQTWTILDGLVHSDIHTIEIVKLTEASYHIFDDPHLVLGVVVIESFVLDGGARLLDAHMRHAAHAPFGLYHRRMGRQIVFLGDSDTNGFGCDGVYTATACDFKAYQNCALGFASLLARHFGARYDIEAWTGKGIVQNAVGVIPTDNTTMQAYWNRTIAVDPSLSSTWDFSRYASSLQAPLVIIYLGSNDFHNVPPAAADAFEDAYSKILRGVVKSYSEAHVHPTIVSICGGRGTAALPCALVKKVSDAFARGAYPSSHYIGIPGDGLLDYPSDYGCLGHRNAVGQMKVAQYLAPIVGDIMGWA